MRCHDEAPFPNLAFFSGRPTNSKQHSFTVLGAHIFRDVEKRDAENPHFVGWSVIFGKRVTKVTPAPTSLSHL